MTAEEYLKAKYRMTKNCDMECEDCPFEKENNESDFNCDNIEIYNPEKAVEIVESWAKEHPQKTRLTDFLEKYPNAKIQ